MATGYMPRVTLDPDDLRGLARACAKRFPGADAQRRHALAAGLPTEGTVPGDAEAAWELIFRAADERGRLPALATALAREAPGDETLTALARTLGAAAAPERSSRVPLVLGAAGIVLMIGAGWAFLGGGEEQAADPLPRAVPTTAPVVIETPVAAEAPVEVPAPTPAPPVVPAPAPPAPAVVVAASGRLPPGCTGAPAGEIVGYWYAGEKKPGERGDVITLDRDARVRADYPRRENHNNFQLPERCVLSRGSSFTLELAPIDASKGRWWVPVVGGG